MKIIYNLLLVCFVSIFFIGNAQNNKPLYFNHLDENTGLSNNSITSIAQDSLGMMWFGTRYGLCSYDGTRIRSYYANRNQKNTLFENQIKSIKVKGLKLYLQLFGAISVYDIRTEQFSNINLPDVQAITLSDSVLWVATSSTLYNLSLSNNQLTRVYFTLPTTENITSLTCHNKELYIGTSQNLYTYSPQNGLKTIYPNINIVNIYVSKRGDVWLATMKNGAIRIKVNQEIEIFQKPKLSHNFVRCINQDKEDNIWIGTLDGLDELNLQTGNTKHYHYNPFDNTQLSHNSIWALYCDKLGTMWAGTYFGGINYFNSKNNLFEYYPVNTLQHESLNFHIVGAICNDKYNNLYIGTEGGGLNYYNRNDHSFTYYSKDAQNPNAISCNNIKDIYNYKDSVLLVATHTGSLNLFDLSRKTFKSLSDLPQFKKNIPSNAINDIKRYQNNFILSSLNGCFIFNISDFSLKPLLPGKYEKCLVDRFNKTLIDTDGKIWIGGERNGLIKYDPTTQNIKVYKYDRNVSNSLSSNFINNIFQDRKGRIWICTQSGLNLYHPKEDNFELFTTENGLASDIILNMAITPQNRLIVAMDKGIARYNEKQNNFTNVTKEDGLPLNIINNNSLFVAPWDEIFIGGMNGMTSFYEDDIFKINSKGNIHITSLLLKQKNVIANDSTNVLKQNIALLDHIKLSFKQNTFTFQFSDLSTSIGRKRKLAYKLENFDQDFIVADASNQATYTNIPSGQYRFIVQYANPDKYSANQIKMDVTIYPPFYFSWWAITLYIIIALSLLILLNRLYLRQRKAAQQLIWQEKKQEQEREYNQTKINFFTNVSHEFRTPLTLISGQLELALENFNNPKEQKYIQGAYKNTQKLRSLVDELLDFQKQENEFPAVHLESGDINNFIREAFNSFIELSQKNNIQYLLELAPHPIEVLFDKRSMEKVIYNLIQNAFKYTQEGSIKVSVSSNDDKAIITVSDTGIGIKKENLQRIFSPFYRELKPEKLVQNISGTGLGLSIVKHIIQEHGGQIHVESQENKGSSFEITLPINTSKQLGLNKDQDSDKFIEEEPNLDNLIDQLSPQLTTTKSSILVVEDNLEMLNFLFEILSPFYEVHTAMNGIDGYQKALEINPALILSDVMMPNMSGTDLCLKVKTHIETSHIPVILITARTTMQQKIEGYSSGADGYVTKPFNIKLLITRIDSILSNRVRLQEKFSKESVEDVQEAYPKDSIDGIFLEKAASLIEKNIDNTNYSVTEFASDMCMGRTTFFRKIKSLTNLTPNDFILMVRLKHAVKLMKTNHQISVGEISDKCGFSSQQYFSSCFKRKFGVSPAQFMKKEVINK